MTLTRRSTLATGPALLALSGAASGAAQAAPAPGFGPGFGYVCTYTTDAVPAGSGHGDGILLVRVDPRTGVLAPVKSFSGSSPSWICFNAAGDRAYAVNEIDGFGGGKQGSVTAFARDAGTGELRQLNVVGSVGTAPVFAQVHPSGRFLLVANYGTGQVVVLRIEADGSLGAVTDVQAPQGTLGPTKAAAAAPGSFAFSGHTGSHAHMVATDPSGRFVLSTDLGYDRIYVWTLDGTTGKLAPAAQPSFATTTAGAGARHFAFRPDGRVVYVAFEEASQIGVYRFDPATGAATPMQTVGTLPAGFTGSSFASSVCASRDGRFVYCGNRLHNSISTFAVAGDGSLRMVGNEWTRGDYPNQVALNPGGTLLTACNRRSDQVTTFLVDRSTGVPRFSGKYLAVGSPNMIGFPSA